MPDAATINPVPAAPPPTDQQINQSGIIPTVARPAASPIVMEGQPLAGMPPPDARSPAAPIYSKVAIAPSETPAPGTDGQPVQSSQPPWNGPQWANSLSPELVARGQQLQHEAERLKDEYHSAAGELLQQANQAPPGSKERDDLIADLRGREHEYMQRYQAIASQPPVLKPADALTNFGSAATIIALIGGLFARNHMTTALSAAGKAMQAMNQNNYDRFKVEYQNWQQASTTALDMVKLQNEEIREIINDKKMATDERNARLSTAFQAFGMQRQADQMALGLDERVFTEMAAMDRAQHTAAQATLGLKLVVANDLISKGVPQEDAYSRAGITTRVNAKNMAASTFSDEVRATTGHEPTYNDWVKFSQETGRQATGQLSPDAVKLMAKQFEMGDPGAITSLPRGGPARIQVENQIAEDMRGLDDAARQITMNRLRMAEAQSAARTAGRITMNTELYAKEAEGAGKLVVEASKLFPRTNLPTVNAALAAFEKQTGDPNVIKFGVSINALMNAYGKMSNPTGTGIHDADKERLAKQIDVALSQGQIEAGVQQIIAEGRNVSSAAQAAQAAVLGQLAPQPPGTPPTAPAAVAPTPATQLPSDLPSPAGLKDGTKAKDDAGHVVAIIKNGQWVTP